MSGIVPDRLATARVALVRVSVVISVVISLAGCGGGGGSGAADAADVDVVIGTPVFSAEAETTWQETRDCRNSHEHELRHVRVFADAQAVGPFLNWDAPFPVGATIIKVEYDDEYCQVRVGYTAMQKGEVGSNPEGGDWFWQKLDADRKVLEQGAPHACVHCHEEHCDPPEHGFDFTCAEEI